MRRNKTCCWLITAEKSIAKRTVAPIANRSGAMQQDAAPGRIKARKTGPCRSRPLVTIKLAGTAIKPTKIEPTKKEASSVPGNQLSSPQRGQHRKTPGQYKKAPNQYKKVPGQHKKVPGQHKNTPSLPLRRAVQIRMAATTQPQPSVLHKKALTKQVADETGQTLASEPATAGTISSDT